jgi:hypothetical protein
VVWRRTSSQTEAFATVKHPQSISFTRGKRLRFTPIWHYTVDEINFLSYILIDMFLDRMKAKYFVPSGSNLYAEFINRCGINVSLLAMVINIVSWGPPVIYANMFWPYFFVYFLLYGVAGSGCECPKFVADCLSDASVFQFMTSEQTLDSKLRSATAYSICSQLPSLSGGHLLHPHQRTCHAVVTRVPLNMKQRTSFMRYYSVYSINFLCTTWKFCYTCISMQRWAEKVASNR